MRTTVGPLPPGVYWRRRAAVLGAALLAVLILYAACSGGDDKGRPGAGPGLGPGSPPASGSPAPDPSFEDAAPGGGPSLPSPDEVTGSSGSDTDGDQGGTPPSGTNNGGINNGGTNNGGTNNGGTNNGGTNAGAATGTGAPDAGGANVAAASGGQCTDAEMTVIPVPARTSAQRGAPIDIRLRIKNVAPRTCARDVGADLQEIYIKQGARKVWSSDTCGTARGNGSQVLQFSANYEADYGVTWNGRESSRCSSGLAVGPTPPPGDYEVFGRLGGKISAPITLTLS